MSKRADLPAEQRLAVQAAVKGLIVAHGSQEKVGKLLGYSGSAIGKAERSADVGYGVRDALLEFMGIDVLELVRRYAPQGSIPFVGNSREPGFEGRTSAIELARKRGVSDQTLRLIVTDPVFNGPDFRNKPIVFWSSKIDELERALSASLPRAVEKEASFGWDAEKGRTVVGPSRRQRPPPAPAPASTKQRA